jgi:light-regulated signal transduction histidine kinase (bacteriophytochrome)
LSRIQILLDNAANARVLADMLGRRHEIGSAPSEESDLAIVDSISVHTHAEFLRARKAAEAPVFYPVLLVTARQSADIFGGPLAALADEIVLTPVEKVELFARVEMLLRARRLSLELRLRKDDLEAFIHAMTHDLRAPLRTVSGFAQIMVEDQGERLNADGRRQLDRIQSAVKQMWELIESLVAFSRIGRKAVRMKTVSLDQAVDACLLEMRHEIEGCGAQVERCGPLGEAEADPSLLKIAICNLISNGIKYVAKDVEPHLEISARRTDSSVHLEFRDNGIGFKEEDQQRIFTPFVRLHGEEDYPGLGLGLSAMRKVVEIIGGRSGVESAPGKGSTFWIELAVGGAQ